MTTQLVKLPEVERLSSLVIRIVPSFCKLIAEDNIIITIYLNRPAKARCLRQLQYES